MSPSELLKVSKQYIVEHGWCNSGPSLPTGEVCAAVAMCKVLNMEVGTITLVKRAAEYLGQAMPNHCGDVFNVIYYNDCVCGRQNDDTIYDWFDRAIALAEEQESGVDHGSPAPDETCNHIDPPEEDCPFCGVKAPEYTLA